MTATDYLTRAYCGNLFKTYDFTENLKVMQLTSSQDLFLLIWEFVTG